MNRFKLFIGIVGLCLGLTNCGGVNSNTKSEDSLEIQSGETVYVIYDGDVSSNITDDYENDGEVSPELTGPSEPHKKIVQCPVCYGSGRCGGCGGSGQTYSVFYGDEVGAGRYVDCSSCEGSGACGACGGTGMTEYAGW